MARHIAFRRGINVGGHRVKMDRLRTLFEDLDLDDVETFIASGNVIFDTRARDAKALEKRIERHLAQELGYGVATFIRSVAELATIAELEPFDAGLHSQPAFTRYVVFLADAASKETRQHLADLHSDMDEFRFHGREIHWLCRGRLSDSRVAESGMAKAMKGVSTTARNITTIRKLAAKCAGRPT